MLKTRKRIWNSLEKTKSGKTNTQKIDYGNHNLPEIVNLDSRKKLVKSINSIDIKDDGG